MKTGWVIKVYQDRFQKIMGLYYTGYIYTIQGDLYGAFNDIEEAKVYTSQKRATNAMEMSDTELIIERINNCLTMGDLDNLRMEIACGLGSRSFEDIKKIQKAFISRKNKIKRNGGEISWN